MSEPRQDKDATDTTTDTTKTASVEPKVCTIEELYARGGPGFQEFAEQLEALAQASGIPGYAVVALNRSGLMSSFNGGTNDNARTLCGELAIDAGNELVKRMRAAAAMRGRPN
jgi:hypothetical protein